MSKWLDTETRAILQKSPPKRLAPSDTVGFSLVMIGKGKDLPRTIHAIIRVCGCAEPEAERLADRSCPWTICAGLTYEDAMLGQFELVCCDCRSVFLNDEVVRAEEQPYLRDLYAALTDSDEFQEVSVRVVSVPAGEPGQRFLDQFLGWPVENTQWRQSLLPRQVRVMWKKGKIMAHWSRKIGADVTVLNT